MSHRAALRPEYRSPYPRRETSSASRHCVRETAPATYTIAHAGRQVRFGPVAFWIVVGTVVIMAGWSIITATYFAFHDDVVKHLIARQQAQQYAYEDRIAELRTQIDRATSRQMLDQEQFEQKLSDLVQREATLESRADALSGVTDTTGSIAPAVHAAPQSKPSALGGMFRSLRQRGAGDRSSIETKLDSVAASLERVERNETAALDQLDERYGSRVRRIRAVLDGLGVKPHLIPQATGGPFVPVTLPPASQGFARMLTRVSIARAEAEDLHRALTVVPLRRPLSGQLEMTSPFGVRVDPFLGRPEMHTGMDFRANVGDPVHATAAGTVTIAGRDGGYGNMVEINHGNGLATRYAHLSEISVTIGQNVRAGEVIGHVGSTGRSTGPHLHYETRVNGEAVNPERFLSAGEKLFGGETVVRASRHDAQD